MRGIAVVALVGVLLAGCGAELGQVPGSCSEALCSTGPMFYPVGASVSYVMPLGAFENTVAFEGNYVHFLNQNWDLVFSAGAMRYTWDGSPATKADIIPLVVSARYRKDMLSGASWYTGFGLGYSINDPTDMDSSFVARLALGMEQPVGQRTMMGLECAYTYSRADARWGTIATHDLSNIAVKLNLVYMIGP